MSRWGNDAAALRRGVRESARGSGYGRRARPGTFSQVRARVAGAGLFTVPAYRA